MVNPDFFTLYQSEFVFLPEYVNTSLKIQRNYGGIEQGRRDDLTGGGFMRSVGSWSVARRQTGRMKGDRNQRILGDRSFVMRILAEANE